MRAGAVISLILLTSLLAVAPTLIEAGPPPWIKEGDWVEYLLKLDGRGGELGNFTVEGRVKVIFSRLGDEAFRVDVKLIDLNILEASEPRKASEIRNFVYTAVDLLAIFVGRWGSLNEPWSWYQPPELLPSNGTLRGSGNYSEWVVTYFTDSGVLKELTLRSSGEEGEYSLVLSAVNSSVKVGEEGRTDLIPYVAALSVAIAVVVVALALSRFL